MKAADARAMTLDQLDDEVLKLKKEQFNCASSVPRASSRIPRACASFAATSRE